MYLSFLTVVVGGDGEHIGLSRGDGLGKTEKGSSKGPDPLFVQHRGSLDTSSGSRDLDAESVAEETVIESRSTSEAPNTYLDTPSAL